MTAPAFSSLAPRAFPWVPPEQWGAQLQLFWQVDLAERELRPHAAHDLRATFLEGCERQTAAPEALNFLCALARREAEERSVVRHLPLGRWLHPPPPLPWGGLEGLPFPERTAWKARGFLTEPLRADRSAGQGFLALESLTRLFPSAREAAWWKYLAAVSQRYPVRIAAAERELVGQGVRVSDAVEVGQAVRDGVGFGVAPQIGYRSFFGFFAGLRFWDERLNDLPRGISGGVQAFSNLSVNAAVNFWDRQTLRPVGIETDLSAGWDRHRYFGSSGTEAAYVRQGQLRGRMALGYEIFPAVTARAGYAIANTGREYLDGGGALSPVSEFTVHGPEASLTYDRRDSAVVPRTGMWLQTGVRHWLSSTEPAQTEVWARGDKYHSLTRRLSWNVSAAASHAASHRAGNLARHRLPLWGAGALGLPGVAQERYRARQGVGVSSELQNEFSEGLRGLIFLTALALRDPLPRADTFLWGGGIGGEIAFTRLTRPTLRFELGWLSGAWTFRTDWRVAL